MSSMVEEELVTDPKAIVVTPSGSRTDVFLGILTFIGRSPDCDICINAAGIAELHAIIAQTTAGLIVKDCFTDNGIQVNNEATSEALLGDGDVLTIDKIRLEIKLPSAQSSRMSDVQIQQDLIQQMARRISAMDARRRQMVQRAWTYRRLSKNSSKQLPGDLAAAQKKIAQLQAELAREQSFERAPTLGVDTTPELIELRTQLAEIRKKHAEEVGLAADRIRTLSSQVESYKQRMELQASTHSGEDLLALQRENEELKAKLEKAIGNSEEAQARESLQAYEQQLTEFRDQLAADADALQQREAEMAEHEREVRIAEEQLQARIAETEKEMAAERAKIKREQSQIERMLADARMELVDIQREAETLERDEKLMRLRNQLRSEIKQHAEEPAKLSDKISKFLKGFGK